MQFSYVVISFNLMAGIDGREVLDVARPPAGVNIVIGSSNTQTSFVAFFISWIEVVIWSNFLLVSLAVVIANISLVESTFI